jgi:hypothetical protein
MTQATIKILDQLCAVNLDVVIWTARKKLTAEDFGNVELPPEELATLGSKKICDPGSLKIFTALKARAVTVLEKTGVRFLSGFAIPEDRTESVNGSLLSIQGEFNKAKADFLRNYDQAVQGWIDSHPGWEKIIASATVRPDQVEKRLSFNWQFFKVAPSEASGTCGGTLITKVDALGETLFGEISREARTVWSKVYAGKTEVTHKALSPLKTMRDKLAGLTFVEPRVAPVADLIDTALKIMPRKGLINGQALLTLQGLVSMLRDPELLLEHGQKVIDGHSPREILARLDSKSVVVRDSDELEQEQYLDNLDSEDSGTTGSGEIQEKRKPNLDSLGLW